MAQYLKAESGPHASFLVRSFVIRSVNPNMSFNLGIQLETFGLFSINRISRISDSSRISSSSGSRIKNSKDVSAAVPRINAIEAPNTRNSPIQESTLS